MTTRGIFTFFLLLYVFSPSHGQRISGPSRVNPFRPESVPHEVIVKFKDESGVKVMDSANSLTTGIPDIDRLFAEQRVSSLEKVFPNEKKQDAIRHMRLPDGTESEVPRLSDIFLLKTDSSSDIMSLIKELNSSPFVDYAEPNYFVYALGSPVILPDDPLYTQQPWLQTINAPAAWDSTTGDSTQVIAIIDSGVDWLHPDLAPNIWINMDEIPGNGIDDDNNGYHDDVRGWDFINNDNNPTDDNSHGTHVAGIAAARGNNGIGITGVAWNAKIMSVKMLQSSGAGTMVNLAKAINYASKNGATVINLSLGYYSESMTVKTALENAYAGTGSGEGAILVAAAGNDGNCICNDCSLCFSMFPACYPFVIGVMASGPGTDFTNFDPTGPTVFTHDEQYNYEIAAPGANILSTLPYGSYGYYSGTSMAAPMVSGAVALMRTYDPDQSAETLLCRLIQGSPGGILDVFHCLDPTLTPSLLPMNLAFQDTLPDCNRNGIANAGETVNFSMTVQNSGGYADSVRIIMRLQNPSDTAFARVTDSLSYLGDISSFASALSSDPMYLSISPSAPHHTRIPLLFLVECKNTPAIPIPDTMDVFRTDLLWGRLDSTRILTPDKRWIVYPWFIIEPTGILIIKPGTELECEKSIENQGMINAIGTSDSLIRIYGPGTISRGSVEAKYVHFQDTSCSPWDVGDFSNCIFDNGSIGRGNLKIVDCLFKNGRIEYLGGYRGIVRCNFINFTGNIHGYWVGSFPFKYCNFSGTPNPDAWFWPRADVPQTCNNFLTGPGHRVYGAPRGNVMYSGPQYWGTTDTIKIDDKIYDFWEDPSLCVVRYQPILVKPSDSAHGIVWKVLINGVDPQDERPDPLGPGLAKFEVFFNRAMDINFTPLLTFSAWEPYTHRIVKDSASWNNDSTVWSAWYDIGPETGDGINVIKVSGARDNEGWEVPPEFNNRFTFVIQAASSAAAEFTAVPGINRIRLTWQGIETPDQMGYNLYRYVKINDSLVSDTLRLNNFLITDTTYTDTDLSPGFTFHYFYRILGTDLLESDRSKIVFASPRRAIDGDANGDESVDILDISIVVAYILGLDPPIFLFETADVNHDFFINILDILGIINIIMNEEKLAHDAPDPEPVRLQYKSDEIRLYSTGQVAAIQFELNGQITPGTCLEPAIPGFEFSSTLRDGKIIGILWNMNNKYIPKGNVLLARITGSGFPLKWGSAVAGDIYGRNVGVLLMSDTLIMENPVLLQAQPNPFSESITITYTLDVPADIDLKIFSATGTLVAHLDHGKKGAGLHIFEWNPSGLTPGIYLCRLEGKTEEMKTITANIKLISGR